MTETIETPEIDKEQYIDDRIQYLKSFPQAVQRTREWYEYRHNLITASNAYKAFDSQSAINQLIYEKCQPLKLFDNNETIEHKNVNTNSPLHWGQKYEPLSVLIYEEKYGTKVDDFGCIKHSTYSFLGASPDGIVTNKESERYGRMLEIKNVVSREITGIPKKEYAVQMQLQMEVCDLDFCDFLETKFVEYECNTDFVEDQKYSLNENTKGIIIFFYKLDGSPFYVYKPLNLKTSEDISLWQEENINLYESEEYNYTFVKYIYWKLEVFSCVLIERNREWFAEHIPKLAKVWKTIEEERITGYEHRAPKRRKRELVEKRLPEGKCLLKIVKIQ